MSTEHYDRRETLVRRVEFHVSTRFISIHAAIHAALAELAEHGVDPGDDAVYYRALTNEARGTAVISFDIEVDEVDVDEVGTRDLPSGFDNEAQLRILLADAFGAADDAPWEHLLELARARTEFLRTLDLASSTALPSAHDAPILALLPRRWPLQVDELVQRGGAPQNIAARFKRAVDAWVLSAQPETLARRGTRVADDPISETCD